MADLAGRSSASSFEAFLSERKAASDAFVNGDVGPLLKISATASPATIFGPVGTCIQGPTAVNQANSAGSTMFQPGGENRFDIMHSGADNQFAYWVGVQRSAVNMRGEPEAVVMDLRVTEIFRREDDGWKLIHRHADQLHEPTDE